MSHRAKALRPLVFFLDGTLDAADLPVAAVDVGPGVRPGHARNRTKAEPEQKIKKPADSVPKKTPPLRKTPARGRYIDEYARPPGW